MHNEGLQGGAGTAAFLRQQLLSPEQVASHKSAAKRTQIPEQEEKAGVSETSICSPKEAPRKKKRWDLNPGTRFL